MSETSQPQLSVVRLPHGQDLPLPAYQSKYAAGMDLRAACPKEAPLTLLPGERVLVPTGLIMEIAQGYEGQIRPRSGLALKNGITCLNTPGTIDSDYRGEIMVLLINLGQEKFVIERGMRIAQIVLAKVEQMAVVLSTQTEQSERGGGGFGSTGVK